MDAVLSKAKGICLGIQLKCLNGLQELTGKLRKVLLCPLIAAILGIGWRNGDCTIRTLVNVWCGEGDNDLWWRYNFGCGDRDDFRWR